ncbi:hypothetical protein AACB16_00075, partial [Enterococcus faecium]
VLTIISYFAVKLEMVNRFTVLPTWTLPAPIGGYFFAGKEWRGVISVSFLPPAPPAESEVGVFLGGGGL